MCDLRLCSQACGVFVVQPLSMSNNLKYVIVITHLAGCKCFNVRARLVHYVTLTVIASPERATVKHAKPAQCVITILVLSRTSNQQNWTRLAISS